MAQSIRHCLWIALAAGTVFFLNLGVPQLWDEDEPKNAACAREMLERNDWVVPMFNYELRTAKPVLLYWFMMSAYELFGVSEFGARFWSAVLGIGTCLLTYGMGRRLFSPQAGMWSALMLAAALMFGVSSRAATPDAPLIFFSTLSLAIFVWGLPQPKTDQGIEPSASVMARLRSLIPQSWTTYIAMYAAMAVAVLAKGPVGIALPTLIIMGYLWARYEAVYGVSSHSENPSYWQRTLDVVRSLNPVAIVRIGWALRPLTAVALLMAIALPWYIWVGLRTDGAWIAGFLGKHNLDRFTQPLEGHSGPIFYYVIAVMIGFFPWSVFLPLACVRLVQRLGDSQRRTAGDDFCASWAFIYIGFFSLASTKLPSYVLPAYPALALITGRWVVEWLAEPARTAKWLPRWGFLNLVGVGAIFLVGVPLATARFIPQTWFLGWAGAILIVGGLLAWRLFEGTQNLRAVQAYATASLLFTTALFGIVAVQINPYQTSAAVMSRIFSEKSQAQIATFDYFEPSLAYYAGRPVARLKTAEQAVTFLRQQPDSYLILRDKDLAEIQAAFPHVGIIERRARFLKKGDIVLLSAVPAEADIAAVQPDTGTRESRPSAGRGSSETNTRTAAHTSAPDSVQR